MYFHYVTDSHTEAEKCFKRAEVTEDQRVKRVWLIIGEAWLTLSENMAKPRFIDEPEPARRPVRRH